jgi:hypothetical protein
VGVGATRRIASKCKGKTFLKKLGQKKPTQVDVAPVLGNCLSKRWA